MQRRRSGKRAAGAVLMTLLWPIASFHDAVGAARAANPVKPGTRARVTLAARAWFSALAHSIPPYEFVAYRLFEAGAHDTSDWLFTPDFVAFAGRYTDEAAARLLRDKVQFSDFCRQNGFECIETLAVIGQSGFERPFAGDEPPHIDLVVKPVTGQGGRDIEGYAWSGQAFAWRGRSFSPQHLIAHLIQRGPNKERLLVQPWMKPHPVLAHLATPAMPAVRLITARFPDGRVINGPAMLQIPDPGLMVSNGGPYRLVDVASGEILPLYPAQKDPIFDGLRAPAGTDELNMPDWAAARDAALEAHRRLPGNVPLVGWDILFSDRGPVFCEANTSISFYFFQAASGAPANTGELAACLDAWLTSCN